MIRRLTKNDMRELSLAEQNRSTFISNDSSIHIPFEKIEQPFEDKLKGRKGLNRIESANVFQDSSNEFNREKRSLKISPIKRTISYGTTQMDAKNEIMPMPKLRSIVDDGKDNKNVLRPDSSILVNDKPKTSRPPSARVRFEDIVEIDTELQEYDVSIQNSTPIKENENDLNDSYYDKGTFKQQDVTRLSKPQQSKLRLQQLKKEIDMNSELFYYSMIEQKVLKNKQRYQQFSYPDKTPGCRYNRNILPFTREHDSFNTNSFNTGRSSLSPSSSHSNSLNQSAIYDSYDQLSKFQLFGETAKGPNISDGYRSYLNNPVVKSDQNSPFNISSDLIKKFCKEEDNWRKTAGFWFIEPIPSDTLTEEITPQLNNKTLPYNDNCTHAYTIREMVMNSLKKK